MSNQRMWLVCSAHPDTTNGICLGKRLDGGYYRAPSAQELNRWYDTHEHCVPEHDHFKLAFDHMPNFDCTPVDPATNIPGAVRLALVKS